jgi:hypothetical protein
MQRVSIGVYIFVAVVANGLFKGPYGRAFVEADSMPLNLYS